MATAYPAVLVTLSGRVRGGSSWWAKAGICIDVRTHARPPWVSASGSHWEACVAPVGSPGACPGVWFGGLESGGPGDGRPGRTGGGSRGGRGAHHQCGGGPRLVLAHHGCPGGAGVVGPNERA